MIDSYTFGTFVVDGKRHDSDIYLLDDKVGFWGRTDHVLTMDNIKRFVSAKVSVLIIGTGASGVFRVPDEIKRYLQDNGIEVIIQRTQDACNTYNELIKKGENVAAILHNTC